MHNEEEKNEVGVYNHGFTQSGSKTLFDLIKILEKKHRPKPSERFPRQCVFKYDIKGTGNKRGKLYKLELKKTI